MYARRVHNAIQLDNIGMPAVDRDQREQREHFCGGTEGRYVVRRRIAIPIKVTENWQNKLNEHTHTPLPRYCLGTMPQSYLSFCLPVWPSTRAEHIFVLAGALQ
jgi:hypothetical protein